MRHFPLPYLLHRGLVIPVIRPGILNPAALVSRAQPGGALSTTLGSDDATWVECLANVPRYIGSGALLLIEGTRLNAIRNPRGEGAVAGTPGTDPINWFAQAAALGITRQIVATGVENGLRWVEYRYSGTATGAYQGFVSFDTTGGTVFPAASSGQTWTGTLFVRLSGGSLAGCAPTLALNERQSGGGVVATTSSSPAITSTLQRFAVTRTLNNALTVGLSLDFLLNVTSGATVDVTLRFYAPQMEQGGFASSPILPPVGAPAASTRGADVLTWPLSSLNIGGNGACTVLFRGQLDAVAGVAQSFFSVSDGTITNRFEAWTDGTSGVFARRATAGAAASSLSAGAVAAGTEFRFGMTCNGAGRAAASLEGGAVVSVTGGPTSGLINLRVGSRSDDSTQMAGRIRTVQVLPFALSDAALQSTVGAL